jgi:methylated-DNA-protein-cysteine methyltransferase related protein
VECGVALTAYQKSPKKLSHTKKMAASAQVHERIRRAILSVPHGKVATYGSVARAAGYPGASRLVARVLHQSEGLPWQRILGAGGAIKVPGEGGFEQRFRLQMEGVTFRGRRVDMKLHEHRFTKNPRTKATKSKSAKARRTPARNR